MDMILTIQYMSSMIRIRERMKVRRRQQWPSRLNPWLFLQNIFQLIDFCRRNIFIRRLSVFDLAFISIVDSPAKAHRDVLVGFLLLEGHLLQGDLVFRIFGI